MITLSYAAQLDSNDVFKTLVERTAAYTAQLAGVIGGGTYDAYESSACLPTDEKLLADVQALAAEKCQAAALKYHIVVGIGGSNLGTKAVYDALHGYGDVMQAGRFPKLLFAETTDPEWLEAACNLAGTLNSPEEVLVSVISKSGGTTETLANFEIIMDALTTSLGDCRNRIVAISDEGSALWEQAGIQGVSRLAIPKPVGGRYSVLSAVGLFPLQTVGIDIAALRTGAAEMRGLCLGEASPAARSAAVLAYHLQQGKTINDNFFFHPELESVGKWYRQLMGESIGKAESLDGREVHAGITPTVSLGSTDLHSVGQLYLGGPKDKLTTFVHAATKSTLAVPSNRVFPELVSVINGKTAADITQAILEGVKVAYQKASLPYMEVGLDAVDEHSIGAYLQFKMLEMMYLGQLLNVNSFDQPSVEAYKVETKAILEQPVV